MSGSHTRTPGVAARQPSGFAPRIAVGAVTGRVSRPRARPPARPLPPLERGIGEVLAVDPGLTHPGAALVRGGKLVAADRVQTDADWIGLPMLERCNRVAASVVRWAMAHDAEPRVLVVEWPQWYPGSPIDPSDLAGLCGIAGAVAGMISLGVAGREIALQCLSPKPAEVWGQVPKSTTGDPWASPRGMMLERRLEPGERQAVTAYHDALDAAGLGLWAVGRWERMQVMPGAV